MSIQIELNERSSNQCELCQSNDNLEGYLIEPNRNMGGSDYVNLCGTCNSILKEDVSTNINHWRCLNDAIWSEVDVVKVLSYRILKQIVAEGWPQDLLDMMYFEDELLKWANQNTEQTSTLLHKDSNGNLLKDGDQVVLIKDLNIKGGNFTAKRGTVVKNIKLDHQNDIYIEGKIEKQQIVLKTEFVKLN